MKFANPESEKQELTYDDVFLFQNYSDISSRFEVDVKSHDKTWINLPIISANMNAISWKRMCEALARLWALWCLPQDMSIDTVSRIVSKVKNAHTIYDTPITVNAENTIRDAKWLIYKKPHKCVVMVNAENQAIWIFTDQDFESLDQFSYLWEIQHRDILTAKEWISMKDAFDLMESNWISNLPIVDDNNVLKWIINKNQAVRSEFYKPSLDNDWKLELSAAVWINNISRAVELYELWITTIVLDTAHWYQKKMIEAIKAIRRELWDKIILVAWNISTSEWVEALVNAWADWIKVWIWPGAMCTTRVKTWVWRPQFSAVYHCAKQARSMWAFIRADGWIKNPRDLTLALAAWASWVMFGSILAWTYESTWDFIQDSDWSLYKVSYWMASQRAVLWRNRDISKFQAAQKSLYQEWISHSKIYMKEWKESVWNYVDDFIMWLRSAMTYVWARNLEEFHEKAIIWVQNWTWLSEWQARWALLR